MTNGNAVATPASPLPAEVAGALADFVQPLVDAAASDTAATALLAELGWQTSAVAGLVSGVRGALTGVAGVVSALSELADELYQPGPASSRSALDRLVTALETGATLGREVERLAGVAGAIANPPPGLNALPEDMLLLLTDRYLRARHPVVRSLAETLTIYVPAERGAVRPPVTDGSGLVVRNAWRAPAWRLDRLGPVLRDPGTTLRNAFAPGGALGNAAAVNALADALFPVVADALKGLGFSARYGFDPFFDPQLSPDQRELLGHSLSVWLADADESAGDARLIGFSLALLPPEVAGGHVGVAISPWLPNGLQTPFGSWNVHFDVTLGGGPFTVAGWQAQPGTPAGWPGLSLTIRFDYVPPGRPAAAPPVSIAITVGVSGSTFDASLSATVRATPRLDPADLTDGFLRSVLPAQGLAVPVEATLTADRGGIRLAGSVASGGDVVLASIDLLELGPLSVTRAQVKASPRADGIRIGAYGSAAFALGPVKGAADSLGLAADVRWPGRGGNAGPFDVDVEFAPPTGIGLTIDAGAVTGGGFLFFDAAQAQYAGGVHLEFEGISLNAIGLLTTRLPDGSPGFSLLVIVTASGFTPIQLGFGFTLNGVGGLLGINRRVEIDVLRAGIRQRTLDAILFSKDDPTPRAPQIVSTLRTVFPPARGRYVFGPMAIIGWGTPLVLTLEVAVVLELPAPVRLILMGRLRALLPVFDERGALVKLNMDILGVVEFDRRQASLDATLYDSSIAGFAISGDMALRASWGEQPGFALAVGGFHPRFQPPPGFPALRRLTIALSTGDNPRLRLEAYLAITSNTVQLGARLDLYVEAAGFNLAGMLSFDALVQFAPFAFELDIAGSLTLKRGATTLMIVELRLNLTGPAPWFARGHATFQVLFFKITVAFEARFGEAKPVAAPAPVAIWPLLRTALLEARNWGAELPAADSALVTVRGVAPPAGSVLVHPLARVSVRQRVVPLEREISRFANAAPADYRRFSIEGVLVGGVSRSRESTYESFAPAAFTQMSDDERLRAPGYDLMPAGARMADTAAKSGPERPVTLEYETVVAGATAPAPAYTPPAAAVTRLAETGAAGMAELRRTGRSRYATTAVAPTRVSEPRYAVVSRDRLAPVAGAPPTDGSFSSAREAAAAFARANPRLAENVQVVRREEALV